MSNISDEDKARIATAIQRTVADTTIKQIHKLIEGEQSEANTLKRIAGALGGFILGFIFLIGLIQLVLRDKFSESFRLNPSFLALYFRLLPETIFAILPLAFAAYFLFNFRFSMLKCLGIGILVAMCISALCSGFMIYNIS